MDNVILNGANLSCANASYCDFSFSDLSNAVLQDVIVDGASFRECLLNGANMRCLEIGTALFNGARYDVNTLWPNGFDPIQAGCINVEKI